MLSDEIQPTETMPGWILHDEVGVVTVVNVVMVVLDSLEEYLPFVFVTIFELLKDGGCWRGCLG